MRPLASAIVAAALHLPAGPMRAGQSTTVITIAQSDPRQSHLEAPSAAINADGRFVAFSSYTPLAPADTDSSRDIYVFDRAEGRVTLESVPPAGRGPDADSVHPDISGDGRFIVFEMGENIVLRDRSEATTTLLGTGRDPAISADGSAVAFSSYRADSASGTDTNGPRYGIYLADVATGHERRLTPNGSGGLPTIGASVNPSVSADGRYVAFASMAPLELPAGGQIIDIARRRKGSGIYVHDTRLGTTKQVGIGPHGSSVPNDNWGPVISADGRYVAFVSTATNLVAGDRNRSSDIFLADVQRGSIELISRRVSGGSGNGPSRAPAVSGDGRFIAFQSLASDLICAPPCRTALEDINLLWDVFLFDTQTQTMMRLSTDAAGEWMETSSGPAIDGAGATVAFSSRHPIDATDRMNDFDLFVVRRQF